MTAYEIEEQAHFTLSLLNAFLQSNSIYYIQEKAHQMLTENLSGLSPALSSTLKSIVAESSLDVIRIKCHQELERFHKQRAELLIEWMDKKTSDQSKYRT